MVAMLDLRFSRQCVSYDMMLCSIVTLPWFFGESCCLHMFNVFSTSNGQQANSMLTACLAYHQT
jgi:hypothetical protein